LKPPIKRANGGRLTRFLPVPALLRIRRIMRKLCKSCKVEKSEAEFIKQGMYRHPQCDDCRRAYQRDYHHKHKAIGQNGRLW